MFQFLPLILSAIPAIASAFGGGTTAPYSKEQKALSEQQAKYAAALGDTNNPLYKQIYGNYENQSHRNIGAALSEAQGQNRMHAASGRTPLLGNERGGEAIFRNLMQGYQDSGVQSDDQTRKALTAASNGGTAALNAYTAITPSTIAFNKNRLGTTSKGLSDLADYFIKDQALKNGTLGSSAGGLYDQNRQQSNNGYLGNILGNFYAPGQAQNNINSMW